MLILNKEFINRYIKENAQDIYGFICSDQKKYLFGTGKQSVNCIYMMKLLEIDISGILITHKSIDIFHDIPVEQSDSNHIKKEEISVLMSINGNVATEIKPELIKLGYKDVYVVEDWERVNDVIKEAVALDFYISNGIDVNGDTLEIGECMFVNPFIEQRKYRQMLLGTTFSDLIVPGIMRNDLYKNRMIYDIIEKNITLSDVVFDIGANSGVFAGYISNKCKKVISFEPSQAILPYLKRNVCFYRNIGIEEFAVSDYEQMIYFYDNEEYPKYSTTIPTDGTGYVRYKVQSISLDNYVAKTKIIPQWIRIYVNGGEKSIVHGAKQILSNYKPYLLIASDDSNIINDLQKYIEGLEYDVIKVNANNLYCLPRK